MPIQANSRGDECITTPRDTDEGSSAISESERSQVEGVVRTD